MAESKNKFENLAQEPNSPSKKDETISRLEGEVECLKERLHEERFFWCLGFIIAFDSYIFTHMSNWGGPVAILFLEVMLLVIVARKCGVDIVVEFTNKILDGWSKKN